MRGKKEGVWDKLHIQLQFKAERALDKKTIETGLLERGKACDFDYDNQIIQTKKRDYAWTYKDVKG